MNQKHLLRFIKSKLRKEPDTVVLSRDGRKLTLAEVFDSLNLTAYDLSIDMLDMHADNSTFHRFDRFNTKYNPQGSSRLREIFLKTDNLIGGRFLAEVTSEVLEDLALNKYQLAEYRLSIYGRARSEWRKLAAWVVQNRLVTKEVRWMIQVPRLYEVYKASGQVASFGDMLDNIFAPLFEVSLDPAADEQLHQFLSMVVGFDSVDDESRPEVASNTELPPPAQWRFSQQPPYHYWTYYLAANVAVLNQLRGSRGLSQFSFRPHAGEAGDVEHLAATFLTAEGINHGINLRRSPPLQYLYYLAQIGLAMSPLSNNRLFLELTKSPFPDFFAKGLNVSLSTDDPLMLAMTKEPLLEEYAVASQVYKLSSADLCEVARNSVLQSGFEYPFKAHFLGANFAEPGPDGNDIHFTNVPYIRTQFRLEALRGELELLRDAVAEAATGRRALAGGGATAPVPAAASAASAAVAHPAVMHRSVSTVAAEASRMVIVNRHRQ
jgi:AMP deaminase